MTAIGKLNPASYNPRKISPEELERLKRSITEFGFIENIVANKDGTVISGHQRLTAAKQLKMTEIPVYFVDIDKEKEKALNIAMNKISGEWDMSLLPALIESLPIELVSLTGFSDGEVAAMLPNFEAVGEDEQGRLDEKKKVICPNCDHEFTP